MPIPTAADYSVKLGRNPDMGLEGQKAFPFLYSLVNKTNDTWTPQSNPALQPSLACIGPLVKKGQKVIQNVALDPDYNYKLIAIKYVAYGWGTPKQGSAATVYMWYDEPLGLPVKPVCAGEWTGLPLSRFISMTLSFQGSGHSSIMYGGQNTQAVTNGQDRTPIPIDNIQGYDYGFYTVRTPHLLPREGHLVFEISNTAPLTGVNSWDLYVGAAIYGMKVRI